MPRKSCVSKRKILSINPLLDKEEMENDAKKRNSHKILNFDKKYNTGNNFYYKNFSQSNYF